MKVVAEEASEINASPLGLCVDFVRAKTHKQVHEQKHHDGNADHESCFTGYGYEIGNGLIKPHRHLGVDATAVCMLSGVFQMTGSNLTFTIISKQQ
jgi:hypothetical protein